jgi:hypothetical protein
MIKISSAVCFYLSLTPLCYAFCDLNTSEKQSNIEINAIFKQIQQHPQPNMGEKLKFISSFWLNRPYMLYCLGEGAQGEFDQRPIYRTDAFDCETLVDTTLAVAHSNDLASFNKNILNIRYHDNQTDFTHRNHFTNIEWNPSNQKQGYVKDITLNIRYQGKPIAIKNQITINKGQWYQKMSDKRVQLCDDDSNLKQQKLMQLRAKSKHFGKAISTLYYIPIQSMFDKNEQPIASIFSQIPNGTIIQIVTPDSHTEDKVGTDLDISHMGFAFWENNDLYFRNASLLEQKVIDIKLSDYLKRYIHNPTIKGIHLELPLESKS